MARTRKKRQKAGRPQKYSDEQILTALKEKKGMVYLAAKLLGCHADTIYERAKVVPEVADTLMHESGIVDDVAEMKLYEGILAGQPWAVMFRLSHKAKHRGYMTKMEVDVLKRTRREIVEEVVDAPDPAADNPTP